MTVKQTAEAKMKQITKELSGTKIICCNMYYIISDKPAAFCDLYNRSTKKRIKINLLQFQNIPALINSI